MKKFLIFGLILGAFNALAATPTDVCLSMSFDNGKNECVKIINSDFIDDAAAGVCIGLSFDNGKNQCLKNARGKTFSYNELRICGGMNFDNSVNNCMRNAGHNFRNSDRLERRERRQALIESQNAGRFEPVDVCLAMSFNSSKDTCLRTIKAGYISNLAAEICMEADFDSDKNSCLRNSMNKDYTFGDADICKSLSFGSGISECVKNSGTSINERRNTRPRPRTRRTEREVKIERAVETRPRRSTVVREVSYDHNEYVACYERPKTRLVTYTNERQARRGNGKVIGGAAGAVFGQIFGAVTGKEQLGDAISAVGLAVAVYGAVEVADASEIIYLDNGYDCRSYYTADVRVYRHRVERQSCTTKRYYSNRWGQEHEYFETTCSGRKYMTFERNTEIWYN